MSTTHVPNESASGLTTEHLAKALQSADKPMSAKWIRDQQPKHLRVSEEEFETLLNATVRAGSAWRFGSAGKVLYWHSKPSTWVQQCLQQKLLRGAKTKSELVTPVYNLATVKGIVSKTEVEASFKDLVSSGKVQLHPAYMGSRTALYSVRPVDPKDYLSHAIQKLSEKLKVSPSELTALAAKLTLDESDVEIPISSSPAGAITSPQVSDSNATPSERVDATSGAAGSDAQSSSTSTSALLLQAMHEINPKVATGDVVSVGELRKRLDFHLTTKSAFDQAILELAASHRVALHRDGNAEAKTPAERDVLVRDEHGKFYNVVSLRNPA